MHLVKLPLRGAIAWSKVLLRRGLLTNYLIAIAAVDEEGGLRKLALETAKLYCLWQVWLPPLETYKVLGEVSEDLQGEIFRLQEEVWAHLQTEEVWASFQEVDASR